MYSEYIDKLMLAVFALDVACVIYEIPKYLIKHIWSQVNGILRRNNKTIFIPNMQGDNS